MGTQALIREISSIIGRHLSDEYKIFLFGSWLRGDAEERSDVDIGILGNQKVPWDVMTSILMEVDEIPTLRSIDVVDLLATDQDFRSNVLKSARCATYD